jgi:hypothetical protein
MEEDQPKRKLRPLTADEKLIEEEDRRVKRVIHRNTECSTAINKLKELGYTFLTDIKTADSTTSYFHRRLEVEKKPFPLCSIELQCKKVFTNRLSSLNTNIKQEQISSMKFELSRPKH